MSGASTLWYNFVDTLWEQCSLEEVESMLHAIENELPLLFEQVEKEKEAND